MLYASSHFGVRVHPVTGERHEHTGIDLPAPVGARVLAAYAGTVARVDTDGQGRGVINGTAVHVAGPDGWRWSYLHLSRALVVPGATVRAGQVIGLVGATGRATGPHLHFQVSYNGIPVDPRSVLPGVFHGP